jgi:hypothetical protein
MTAPHDVAGTAALAICESLLLALNDHKGLPESEILGVLKDAAVGRAPCASTSASEKELHPGREVSMPKDCRPQGAAAPIAPLRPVITKALWAAASPTRWTSDRNSDDRVEPLADPGWHSWRPGSSCPKIGSGQPDRDMPAVPHRAARWGEGSAT